MNSNAVNQSILFSFNDLNNISWCLEDWSEQCLSHFSEGFSEDGGISDPRDGLNFSKFEIMTTVEFWLDDMIRGALG